MRDISSHIFEYYSTEPFHILIEKLANGLSSCDDCSPEIKNRLLECFWLHELYDSLESKFDVERV